MTIRLPKAAAIISIILATLLHTQSLYTPGNVLLLDHLNINHETHRHDLLKAFYFDALGLSADTRKAENIEKGRKTIWANAGITQFHLPESEKAQVVDGLVTIAYATVDSFAQVKQKLASAPEVLKASKFSYSDSAENECIHVRDPWGSQFDLVLNPEAFDARGVQPGPDSLPCSISDLCFHIPKDRSDSLAGIARFYQNVLGAPSLPQTSDGCISIVVSPQQTLTFKHKADGSPAVHDEVEVDESTGKIMKNFGAHISMYVKDLPASYRAAEALGVTFVNHRFKRLAYTLEDAVDQCMFRCLDIVDPEDVAAGPIIRLEHEVRSAITSEGKKYKSCPFFEIPK